MGEETEENRSSAEWNPVSKEIKKVWVRTVLFHCRNLCM